MKNKHPLKGRKGKMGKDEIAQGGLMGQDNGAD